MIFAVVVAAMLVGSPVKKFTVTSINLDANIQKVLPKIEEEKWLQVPWRTHLMETRQASQIAGKPMFIWIMVGNPQGCT